MLLINQCSGTERAYDPEVLLQPVKTSGKEATVNSRRKNYDSTAQFKSNELKQNVRFNPDYTV